MSSNIAAANWDDDKLSETFSDAFSDAFQGTLRQVRKNVLDRLSAVANGADENGGGEDQHVHMEQFEGWTMMSWDELSTALC